MTTAQIKQDLNRAGWETTDFPSVCETCLGKNPYVQMIKEDHGAECKLCTRPFTVFRWKPERNARTKRTNVCLTCARLKNCCQSCMLDLSFGLPIVVRDAALKMVAPGPDSAVNREYFAQNNEKELAEGRGGLEAYEQTDDKARELLRRLAGSKAYSRSKDDGDGQSGRRPGPVRTNDNRSGGGSGRGPKSGKGAIFSKPPGPEDIVPPRDTSITSLFVTGVEDDLPEYTMREFFAKFGTLRSIVCSHRSHCAFINFQTREGAETAADALQGKAVIAGCPLRVRWGKPKPLGTMDEEEREAMRREGRAAVRTASAVQAEKKKHVPVEEAVVSMAVEKPPGADDHVKYASQAGS